MPYTIAIFFILLVLKLIGVGITWFWVFFPLFFFPLLWLGFMLAIFIMTIVAAMFS